MTEHSEGRRMALDYGARTVGVAVTDPLGITAQGVETIWRRRETKLRQTLARITELVHELDVREIIVGLPLNMDDSEGERAAAAREFAHMVEVRTELPVILFDERLTTVEADEILAESGVPREKRKEYLDMLSAQLILERYMKSLEESKQRRR